jgi:hypothetical protein
MATGIAPDEARSIAAAACDFGYPLVRMDVTMRVGLAAPVPGGHGAAVSSSPTAALDLARIPPAFFVPDTSGHYSLMRLCDASWPMSAVQRVD